MTTIATTPTISAFGINYQKRKNINLFSKFQTNKNICLEQVQNYLPIYDRFFSLNDNNYNSINLNHLWYVSDLKDEKTGKNNNKNSVDTNTNSDFLSEHVHMCKLKNSNDNSGDFISSQNVFIKMAPLLDPFKYIVGKYNYNDTNLFNLPSIDKSVPINPKISDVNNSAYVDGFFSFLTSQLLNTHGFIHGLDYYGSFLAIKKNYKINIIDDIDYLIHSDFFMKQQNVLFKVDDYSHLLSDDDNNKPLKPLKIMSNKSVLSIKSFDDTIFDDIFENQNQNQNQNQEQNLLTLSDIKHMNVDLVDIMNSSELAVDTKKSETLKSGSSCSSRTSHTDENEDDDVNDDDDNDNDDAVDAETNNSDTADTDAVNKTSENGSNIDETKSDNDSDNDSDTNSSDYSDIDEETLYLTFPKFPIQMICLEHCENTFDNLILTTELTNDEWFSALFQIIMTLITYQKMFSFTHNDLHTNNIMYINTNKKFIYYCYKKKYYKVPTFGKIFKIIDFGRAIYKYNGKTFCSDSFQTGGDAATQYNTEPYFNEKKPRLEPNFSFDLCRLACSIFDYVIDDIEDVKNLDLCEPIVKLIVEWCIDDNGINVLYKNNGTERYPDFKLYKMIARCVHNHTPVAQLERPEFNKFVISKNSIGNSSNSNGNNSNGKNNEQIINIDELPSYVN
jgi:hypothetical protein